MLTVGATLPQKVRELSLTLGIVANSAVLTPSQTFTVTGLTPAMAIHVQPTTAFTTGLMLVGARCDTVNILTLTFYNPTAAGITQGAVTFKIIAF